MTRLAPLALVLLAAQSRAAEPAPVYAFAIIEAADIARALNAQCWVAS